MQKSCYEQYKEWNNDPNRDPDSIFAKVVFANYVYYAKPPIKFVVEGEICPPCSNKIGEGKKGNVYLPYQVEEGPPYKFYSDCEAQIESTTQSSKDFL